MNTVGVNVTQKPTFSPRSNFIERQANERRLLLDMYSSMTVGVEQRFMRASRVAEQFGYGASAVDSAVRVFESLGIMTRRLEFGALDHKGKVITGRSYHWTLQLPKDIALSRLDNYHQKEIEGLKPPIPRASSLKTRIMSALMEHQKFETIDDLAKAVRKNGENLDFHNLTHVMESLVREGRITFDRGTSKDKIPYNIRLNKKVHTQHRVAPVEVIKPEDIVMPEVSPVIADDEEPTPVKTIEIVEDTEKYPAIIKLVHRKSWLESAAKLAENAEEEDLAISLLERANKPFTPLEAEAIALYEAYMECKDK